MNLRGVLTVLGVVLPLGVAHADLAVPPPGTRMRSPPPSGASELSAQISFGTTRAEGIDNGWVVRLDYLAAAFVPNQGPGGLFGFMYGLEYWRVRPGTWGIDMPAQIAVGFRAPGIRAHVGLGADFLAVERWNSDTGFGYIMPMASASAGLDVRGVTVMADARIARHWLFGADDHTQLMLTLGVGFPLGTTEPAATTRRRAARP